MMLQKIPNVHYEKLKPILREFYIEHNKITNFERDNEYLEKAFHEITDIWCSNLDQIKEVRYLLIAEAPLWGKTKSYIYNPETKFTQFIFKSDLEYVLRKPIRDKADFIKQCNEMGMLIVDISPFALNSTDTTINYRTIKKSEYLKLIKNTIPLFFEEKIKAIKPKKANSINVFFRYARVQNEFQNLISSTLMDHCFITSQNEILEISKQGGGIDRAKFNKIINPTL